MSQGTTEELRDILTTAARETLDLASLRAAIDERVATEEVVENPDTGKRLDDARVANTIAVDAVAALGRWLA